MDKHLSAMAIPPRGNDCWQDLLGNRGLGVKLDLGIHGLTPERGRSK